MFELNLIAKCSKWLLYHKRTQLEIFCSGVFTHIKPVWVGDLGTRSKSPKFWRFRLENCHFVIFLKQLFLDVALQNFFTAVSHSTKQKFSVYNGKYKALTNNNRLFEFFGLVPKSYKYRSHLCKKPGDEYLKPGSLEDDSFEKGQRKIKHLLSF